MGRKNVAAPKTTSAADESVVLWVAFMQGQATISHAVNEKLETEVGIPLAWHEVLVRLANAPEGALRMQDLAESMLISKSGLTRLCDRIQDAGFVTRASCPTDRRGTYAVITPEGRAKAQEAAPIFFRATEELFLRHLSDEERQMLTGALCKIITANGGHLQWPPPLEERPRTHAKH